MRKVAIIPARGGSKRIPRKNIKHFLGKPIIAYSIEAAIQCSLFDEVMVSTDDEEIAEISRSYGASIPFMRTAETSHDFATTVDVLKEVIIGYRGMGKIFDYGCCIYPTAPFVTAHKLKEAMDLLVTKQFDSVFPVVKFSYPILRSFKIENDRAKMNWPEYMNSRSQDLKPAFHDAGQFYGFYSNSLIEKGSIFTDNSGAIEVDELDVQDIDNLTDWKLAEMKFNLLKEC